MQEQAIKLLSEMDDDEEWIGAHQYTLACIYSLVGQKDKAVRILREALRMSPGLSYLSKKDPDFDPLRDHPDYEAVYAE